MLNAGAEQVRGITACFSTATLAIGGTTSKVKFTAPNGAGIDFSINGIMYHKADADNVWTLSGDTMADASDCIFLLCLNASGTMSVVQGTVILSADIASGAKVLNWPQYDADVCPVGAVRVTTDGATFVPGTTALNSNNYDTYINLSTVPMAPLTSSVTS